MRIQSVWRFCCLALGLAGLLAMESDAGGVAEVEVSPQSVRLQVGERARFQATGKDAEGREVRISPRWAATGGRISRQGVYIADQEGEWEVKALEPWSGIEATARVVAEARLRQDEPEGPERPGAQEDQEGENDNDEKLKIEPERAVVRPGQEVAFKVKPPENNEAPEEMELKWSALVGEVSEEGRYKAGQSDGGDIVIVTDSKSGLEGKVQVTVSTAPEQATGKIKVHRWSIAQRAPHSAQADIVIGFEGPDHVRSARLFYHEPSGVRSQLRFTAYRSGQPIRFQDRFNPSRAVWLEFVVYDFQNRALGSFVRRVQEQEKD